MEICLREFTDPRQRQLFKNIIYVGALSALLNIEFEVLEQLLAEQFNGKEKLTVPNIRSLKLGVQYVHETTMCSRWIWWLERRDLIGSPDYD